jgi:GNAT superfamily N-acetyltransferase
VDLLIREARAGDLSAVLELLEADSFRERPEQVGAVPEQCYADALAEIQRSEHSRVYVAERDGRVVGTYQLTFIRHLMYRGGLVAQIEAVRVASQLRNQGIGAAMMRHAIAEARRRGCARVQLTSNKQRKDAHRFYERLGFKKSHDGFKLYLGGA